MLFNHLSDITFKLFKIDLMTITQHRLLVMLIFKNHADTDRNNPGREFSVRDVFKTHEIPTPKYISQLLSGRLCGTQIQLWTFSNPIWKLFENILLEYIINSKLVDFGNDPV